MEQIEIVSDGQATEVMDDEEDVGFQDIELLLEHNVEESTIAALKSIGINTIKGVQMTLGKKLLELEGLTEEKVIKLKDACCKVVAYTGFVTALEVCEQRKQVFKISTGSSQLDKLLGGGIESMAITEAFGQFSTGKTQLAHTLCVTAQMPNANGYMGGKVIFIDTEHTFRPDRLKTIADRFDLNQTAVLENVLYVRAYNSEHQQELLKSIANKFHEEPGVFKLLIIDSIIALFRVDYKGRGEMVCRQQKLAEMMSRLQQISEEYNVAVYITNHITSDFNPVVLFEETVKPVGGNIIAHASTIRLALRSCGKGKRIARIYDSPDLEETEACYVITNGGIDDLHD